MATENYYSIHAGETIDDAVSLLSDGSLPIANGGTGASTAEQARANLGIDLNQYTPISSVIGIARGGTGATDAATARANLGINLNGYLTTDSVIGIANGGTGATSAEEARSMLGVDTLVTNLIRSGTATIATSAWVSNKATIESSLFTDSNIIFIAPMPSFYTAYANAKIRAIEQRNGVVTLQCEETPTAIIGVQFVVME